MFGQARLKTMMMQSRVDFPLFFLILSLMTASCSAMDNKTPDTKVTAPTHFLGCLKYRGYKSEKFTWHDFMHKVNVNRYFKKSQKIYKLNKLAN